MSSNFFQDKFDIARLFVRFHEPGMTCYNIYVGYPNDENHRVNLMNRHHFQQLVRRHRALFLTEEKHPPYDIHEVALCDSDAAAFIRDLPEPFFIAAIVIRATKILFYTSPHLKTNKRPFPPRGGPVEKDIYWWAASCEKRLSQKSPAISL